jgi:hypothetical protein
VTENDELAKLIYHELLFEFRLWMYAPVDVQLYCVNFLKNFCESRRELCRTEFGIRYFLDMLQVCYWYRPEDRSMSNQHAASGSKRPPVDSIQAIRTVVFDIIKGFLKRRITKDDTLGILKHALASKDYRHVAEVLDMVLELVKEHRESVMVEYVAICGGYEIMSWLLRTPDATVKARVLDLMIFFLASPKIPDRMRRRLSLANLEAYKLEQALGNVTINETLYHALMQYVVEIEYDTSGTNRHGLKKVVPMPPAKNPRALLTLVAAITDSDADDHLLYGVFDDVQTLLNANEDAMLAFSRQPLWQQYLVQLIPTKEACDASSARTALKQLVYDVMCSLPFSTFDVEEQAYRLFEENLLWILVSGRSDAHIIACEFLAYYLTLVEDRLQSARGVITPLEMARAYKYD